MKERKIIFDFESGSLSANERGILCVGSRVLTRATFYNVDMRDHITDFATTMMSTLMLQMAVEKRVEREVALEDILYLRQIHSL